MAGVEVVQLRGGENREDGEDRLSVDRIDYLDLKASELELPRSAKSFSFFPVEKLYYSILVR
jgi:hypothetical protein